jgi:hypothetical protein
MKLWKNDPAKNLQGSKMEDDPVHFAQGLNKYRGVF